MFRFRIHHKVTAVFILIISCLLLGVFLSLQKSLQTQAYQTIRTNMRQKLSLARTLLEHSDPAADPDQMADQIAADLAVRVTIIDDQGLVRGDSDFDPAGLTLLENHFYRPEVQQALKGAFGESRRFSTSTRKDFLYTATRYTGGSGSGGFVRLALPLDEVAAVARRVNHILVVSFFFAFGLSVAASYAASLLISRPIEEIAQGARRVAVGNFNNRVFVAGQDEIADLARTFNEMAQQIHQHLSNVEMGKLQLEAVFSSMREGVLVVDEQGKIFLMNHALRILLNISEDPIGRRPLEVIRNADIAEMIAQTQSGQDQGGSRELEFFVPDSRMMQVQSAPIRQDGKVTGIVMVFHDITELRRLENIRKEFVANVSHELRTPVASIKGYAETLIDGALQDQENAEDFVRIILSDAQRLAKLIEDLLDLSSIESGKMMREMTACSLKSVFDRVLEGVYVQSHARDIAVTVSGLDQDVMIQGDDLGLFRLFLNLIENAVKYNKDGGFVRVEVAPSDAMVEIKISDSGIGIPSEDLPRIFERFYRVDKAHSRQRGGTGLGLSIVKHIVQSHGGTIFVESIADRGSVFTVHLPRA